MQREIGAREMSQEIRRSIFRDIEADKRLIVSRRNVLFASGKFKKSRLHKFREHIATLNQKYEQAEEAVKKNLDSRQFDGVIITLEIARGTIIKLENELHLIVSELQWKRLRDIPNLVDELIEKFNILSRSVRPKHLFIEKPGARFNSKFELSLHLINQMSLTEIKEAAFDVGLDYENYSFWNKVDLSIALVVYCDNNNLWEDLLNVLFQLRPDVSWKKPFVPFL